ncbi:YusU family protein [Paenibacillus oceani]|uniref:YusU family protein n=1 Tax=Paenibacillus oceani TaxID=2772510 RepID=A0A927CBV3_9BACL|nr:YusU family protein [Paenibacillus oceani]MBD2863406.1 YusU family protein [Paenibacillus oceani]
MNPVFDQEFEALVEKFAELLTGCSNPETVEKVRKWAVYNHIHKSMPALTNHWNQNHPEAKREVRLLFEEIRSLNEAWRAQRSADTATPPPAGE